jgi:hypothetical protein
VRSPDTPGECLRTISPPSKELSACLECSLRPGIFVYESNVTDRCPWCREPPSGGGIARPGESSPAVEGADPSKLISCLDVLGLFSTLPSAPALFRGLLPRRVLTVLLSGRLVLLPLGPAVAGVVVAPPLWITSFTSLRRRRLSSRSLAEFGVSPRYSHSRVTCGKILCARKPMSRWPPVLPRSKNCDP